MSSSKRIQTRAPATIGDTENLGEAMAACSALERLFVVYKVAFGLNNSEAARRAGYADGGAGRSGYELAHRERVQAAILEEGRKLMRSEGAKSILRLVQLRDRAKDEKVRLKAATEILSRSGFGTQSSQTVHVEHTISEPELDRRILAAAIKQGVSELEARKLLIDATRPIDDTIDGDFAVVEPAPPTPRQIHSANSHERTRRRSTMSPEEREADIARVKAEKTERQKAKFAAAQAERAAAEAKDWRNDPCLVAEVPDALKDLI